MQLLLCMLGMVAAAAGSCMRLRQLVHQHRSLGADPTWGVRYADRRLIHMRNQGYTHGDLKLENVLVGEDMADGVPQLRTMTLIMQALLTSTGV
jgi:hypothetical protein